MAPQVFVDGLTSDLRKLGLGEDAEQDILDAFAPVLGETHKVPVRPAFSVHATRSVGADA